MKDRINEHKLYMNTTITKTTQSYGHTSTRCVCLYILIYTIICIIIFQVKQVLIPYTSNPVVAADAKLEAIYSAIPYPDKER